MEDKIEDGKYSNLIRFVLVLVVGVLVFISVCFIILETPDDIDKHPIQEIKNPDISSCMDNSCVVIFRSKECSIFMVKVEDYRGFTKQLYFSDNPMSNVYKSFLENQEHIRREGW